MCQNQISLHGEIMAKTVKSGELREKRAALETKIKAEVEKDSLTAEQRTAINKMVEDSEALEAQYKLIERSDEMEKELRKSQKKVGVVVEDTDSVLSKDAAERKEQVKKAFVEYLTVGKQDMSQENRAILGEEQRTYAPLQTVNPAAGYFIPQGFSFEVDEAMKQTGGMLEACRVYPTATGNPLLWPNDDDTANVATIIAEATTVVAGPNPTVGHVTLGAYKYGTMVQASTEQLQDSAFDIGAWLEARFAIRFARGLNADFTNGNGTSAPQGLAIAASPGTTTAGPSSLIYDDLVDLIYSVDPAYRNTGDCVLMFNDDVVRAIRLIKDEYGHPIFQTDPTSNLPDRILGYEFTVNQDLGKVAPGNTVGLFGDFSKYVIRKVNGLFIQVLNERYAEQGLVGYLGFARYDGKLVTSSTKALTKMVMASS
jgi:HK97 family phage major capsid protein